MTTVDVQRHGAVTVVSLERPHKRNAVNPATARALYEAFVAFDHDDNAQVGVLTGSGGAFCAGFDLEALAEDPTGVDAWLQSLHFGDAAGNPPMGPMGPTRLELKKPVIAAIAGPAVAGGMELAMWCHLRVMERSANMGVYCRRWGVPLIDGGTVRLPRLVGMGRAADLIYTGRKIGAEECERMGLCERVVKDGDALSVALDLADEIAEFPAACLRTDHLSLQAQDALPLHAAMRIEFEQGLAAVRHGAVEGAKLFAEGQGRGGAPADAGPT